MNFSCPDREFKVGNCQILVFCGFLFTVTFKALWGVRFCPPVLTYESLTISARIFVLQEKTHNRQELFEISNYYMGSSIVQSIQDGLGTF